MGDRSIRHQMRHRTLDAFRIVYETGSATRAAERLSLTQPAISQAIAALERAVGRALFNRGAGRPLAPTRDADVIYPVVCRALAAMAEVEAIVDEMRREGHRRLRIGLSPALADGFAREVVAKMMGEAGEVDVALTTGPARPLEQAIAGGELDLGLSFLPSIHEDVESDLLFTVDAEVATAPDHRLARAGTIRPRDLAEEAVVIVRSGGIARSRLEAAFAADGVSAYTLVEAPDAAALHELVAARRGVGVVVLEQGRADRRRPLAIRPLRPGLSVSVRLLRRRLARPSPAARIFAEAARRRGEEIVALQRPAARASGGIGPALDAAPDLAAGMPLARFAAQS